MIKSKTIFLFVSLLRSPIGVESVDTEQPNVIQNGQKLFSKATLIKPKTAAEVAAKTLPIVSQFQQQILSPVSTIASETSQSQGKQKSLSPNHQSILLTAQEGIGGKNKALSDDVSGQEYNVIMHCFLAFKIALLLSPIYPLLRHSCLTFYFSAGS